MQTFLVFFKINICNNLLTLNNNDEFAEKIVTKRRLISTWMNIEFGAA